MTERKLTEKEVRQNKHDRIMNTVAWRAAYYRANPNRFCVDYLGFKPTYLRPFQKILLWCMMHYNKFYYIASRSQGKTTLVALFAVIRCILFPGEIVVTTSHTFKQGKDIVLKITDGFMHDSPLLCSEIEKTSTGINDCGIWFKNGSQIIVKVANENTRGTRCSILICDESRMVSQKIVDTILRPMNVPRHPKYLDLPEYKHLKVMPKELYMSSAWYKASEMFEKVKSYFANSLNDSLSYFICSLPYQLSIYEELLMPQIIEDEMNEATFSEVSFKMEREAIFYGASEDALFNFDVLNNRRILQESLHPLEYYLETGTQIPKKQINEKRILSLDVALLASRKHDNDAAVFTLSQSIFSDTNNPICNVSFIDSKEGLLTEELGLLAMRYFYQYDCDYFAIDASGVGQGTLDYIMGGDRFDPQYSTTYKVMTVINNDDLAIRCKYKDATKCIYAIKGNAQLNNDMCLSLRAGFQNGYINLLINENDMEERWKKQIKNYNKLSDNTKTILRLPYYQTSFLIDELINLEHEIVNGKIKVKEKSGMRKDRYSSLEYNYYVVDQIRLKQKKRTPSPSDISKYFSVKAPKISTRYS
jgi:hypothetical protein